MSDTPIWKLKFYGVRGSVPVPGPDVAEFGGNTTCFHLDLLTDFEGPGITVVVDAGTGIRQLGKDIAGGVIARDERILIHFTHYHWDHIQGLPFFAPAYFPDQQIVMHGPHFEQTGQPHYLKQVFAGQMRGAYFPLELEDMGADMRFFTDEEFVAFMHLDADVRFGYYRHNHPGGAYSYRWDGYGRSVAICTDVEHGERLDEDLIAFCQGVDVLVHEAQYTDEELESHRGWGHSSYTQALEVAQRAGAKQLYVTHHDPDHDDAFLRAVEEEYRAKWSGFHLAREGREVMV